MNDLSYELKKNRRSTRKFAIALVAVLAVIAISLTMFDRFGQTRNGHSRVEGEIAAIGAAITSYQSSNGRAPNDPRSTDLLRPATAYDPEEYTPASQILYKALSGDSDGDPTTRSPKDTEMFYDFKPDMLRPSPPGPGTYVVDPFGNSYGYSTFKAKNPKSSEGYNTTYDLWSTNGGKTEKDQEKWVRNW